MLSNSPTSTFNFKKNFRGYTPGPPFKGEEEGEGKGGEKGGREGSPPIHIPGCATASHAFEVQIDTSSHGGGGCV